MVGVIFWKTQPKICPSLTLKGLLILSFHGFSPQSLLDNLVRYLVWLPLLILGFGIATYLSAKLGWANAHGEKDGLIVSGLYRWSRNPIYVASIVEIIGWSLFVNSCYVSTILALWAFMYFLAPFVEEPWLERSYGEEFLAYKGNSSRFFGLPKA